MERFAVVASSDMSCAYKFTKWLDSFEAAQAEALRLATKERKKFYVLKIIGHADLVEVKWTSL